MRRTIAVSICAATMALAAWAPAVMAGVEVGTTRVVDDDGMATAADCGASDAAYTSIQTAHDDSAAGDTIVVCPGTYEEHVVVDRQLHLLGADAGLSAKACATRPEPSIITPGIQFDAGSDGSVLDGFVIDASAMTSPTPSQTGISTPGASSGLQILNNVVQNNSGGLKLSTFGETLTFVSGNCFRTNNLTSGDAFPEFGAGRGIVQSGILENVLIADNGFRGHVAFALDLPGVRNVRVARNVSWNDLTFVNLSGAENVHVRRNKIRQDASGHDDDGVAISVTANAQNIVVSRNVIDSTAQPNGFLAGILVADEEGFDIFGPVILSPDGVWIRQNTIRGTFDGISVETIGEGAVVASGNRVSNANRYGISAGASTDQNVFAKNIVRLSATFDCFDASTGTEEDGVANIWHDDGFRRNIGATSSPAGLCATE